MSPKEVFVEELKKEGLEIGEETAIALAKALFRIYPKVAAVTENKFDDMLIPIIGMIEPQVVKMLDEINPHDNEPEAA